MDIKDIQKTFITSASILGDYQNISKMELCNGYCNADEKNDQLMRSAFWSALMLRYWYKIYDWAKSSESCKLPLEEFVNWLQESLYDAFYYRSWWWEYEAVVKHGKFVEWKLDEHGNRIPNEHYWVKDPNAADKSINYFCAARRGKEYQASNKDVRKANVLAYSLDASKEAVGDSAMEKAGAYEDGYKGNEITKDLVIKFLNEGKSIEALILDGIVNQDAFKEEKDIYIQTVDNDDYNEEDEEPYYVGLLNTWCIYGKNTNIPNTGKNIPYVKDNHWFIEDIDTEVEYKKPNPKTVDNKILVYKSIFDKRKLVKHLSSIDEDFMKYFSSAYEVTAEESGEILSKLKHLKNNALYRYIDKTLINLQNDPVVKSLFGGAC